MIIIFCLNFVLHIIITALKIKKYSCSVDHLKSLEIKMKRKAELAARHTVNIIKISKQDRKLNSQGSPSQQVLKQFWKTPRSQADWNWDCGMQQFHQHMGRKIQQTGDAGKRGGNINCGTGSTGTWSHQVWRHCLHLPREQPQTVRPETCKQSSGQGKFMGGGWSKHTAKRWMALNCTTVCTRITMYIYIYVKLNGNKQLGQGLGGATKPSREHSSYKGHWQLYLSWNQKSKQEAAAHKETSLTSRSSWNFFLANWWDFLKDGWSSMGRKDWLIPFFL